MKQKLISQLFIFIVIFLSITAVVFAEPFVYLDKENNNKVISDGLDIVLIDVSTKGDVCFFKINNKSYVVEKGEIETIGDVKIWVKDVYAVSSLEKNKDICVVLIAGVSFAQKSKINDTIETEKVQIVKKKIENTSATGAINNSLIITDIVTIDNNSNEDKKDNISFEPQNIAEENNIQQEQNEGTQKENFFMKIIHFFGQLFH